MVVRFVFPKSIAQATQGVGTWLVMAPHGIVDTKPIAKLVGPDAHRWLVELARDVRPGDSGAVGGTLTMASPPSVPGSALPRRIALGALPDRVSRYCSEARPEAVHRVVAGAGLIKGKAPRGAILAVVSKPSHVTATLNAMGRAFPLLSRESKTGEDGEIAVVFANARGQLIEVDPIAIRTMENAREAARLVDTPPSELHTDALSAEIRRQLEGLKNLKITEIVGEDLVAAKLGGIYGVGKAAVHPPRLLVASYRPQKATGKHLALVGKGIVFDTGGLHLKARGSMEGMKSDMGGAAACVGAFRTLVEEKVARKLTLVVCIAENAIGPTAFKPDDVLTLHSGKTVEINNTDAEGRLLLGDGVSYAARVLGAEIILDAATLTGAQLMSTGMVHAAVMSNDARLERVLVESGLESGDVCHPLIFAPELFQAEFKSPIADMRNSVKNRNNAQSSCAGQFIYSHIDDTAVRWGHVDLAGPAFRADRGTGYGVALLAEAARVLSK